MKKLKQIVTEVKALIESHSKDALDKMLWQLICYPPKMPLRLQQEQLLNEAELFSITMYDEYFTLKNLQINAFKWGNGKHKVLLSHGWGSKAADFTELIIALRQNPDLQIIAFDAPACGSSEGELANLLMFVKAIEAIVKKIGPPQIFIGHSFGAMASVVALNTLNITPSLLISLTPFVLLQENFIKTMTAVGVPQDAQDRFFKEFTDRHEMPPSYFNLNNHYHFDGSLNHWLAYDEQDLVLPYAYLKDFLDKHPFIQIKNYNGTGHERIIKSVELIADVLEQVNNAIQ